MRTINARQVIPGTKMWVKCPVNEGSWVNVLKVSDYDEEDYTVKITFEYKYHGRVTKKALVYSQGSFVTVS